MWNLKKIANFQLITVRTRTRKLESVIIPFSQLHTEIKTGAKTDRDRYKEIIEQTEIH